MSFRRWTLIQVVVWVPFLVAFALGAPWWIAYAGAVCSLMAPALLVRDR